MIEHSASVRKSDTVWYGRLWKAVSKNHDMLIDKNTSVEDEA